MRTFDDSDDGGRRPGPGGRSRVLEPDDPTVGPYGRGDHGPGGHHDQGYGSPGGDDRDRQWDDDWDDELVTLDRGRSGLVRALVVLVAAAVVLLGGFLLARGWLDRQLDPPGEPGETVAVVIEPGSTTRAIATQLEAEGIIPNATVFRYYVDWQGAGNFQAGRYQMQLDSSADEAIAVLDAGPAPADSTSLRLTEGRWLSEMLPAIAEQLPDVSVEDLQAALDSGQVTPAYRPDGVTSWEGLLFPATYDVSDEATAVDVVTLMSDEFQRVTSDLGYGSTDLPQGRSAYEVITIASMVEAEAKADGDRAKIARVIYNRLEQGWSLDIDATCIYGAGDRRVQLTNDLMTGGVGDYACRNYSGLPPTPIAAPGRAALEAALHPEDGPWLFYVVADAEGHHAFAVTREEHQANVDAAREAGLLGG